MSGRRGARPARREERAYRAYVSDEQRSPAGCIGGQTWHLCSLPGPNLEVPVVWFVLAAALVITGPAEEPVEKTAVVQAFRPAVSGGPKGPHYIRSAFFTGSEAGHDRSAVAQTLVTDARDATLVSPQAIVEIDTGKLKGEPGMLAWSPDGKTLYLQMLERDRKGAVTSTRHYVIGIAEKSTSGVDSQPAWVAKYWEWKAAPVSPATAAFKIVPSEREEVKHAVAPVGEMAKGGGAGGDGRVSPGSTVGEALSAAATAQTLHIWALTLNGET